MMKTRKESGFGLIDFVIYAVCIVAVVGAIYMLVHAVTTFISQTRQEGYTAGQTAAYNDVANRDNKKLAAANAKIKEIADRVIVLQADLDKAIATADDNYQKGIQDGNAKKDSVIADLRSGRLVLRDPGRPEAGTGCSGASSPAVPGASPGGGGDNGAQGTALSGRLSDFLVGKFTDADNDLRQLTAAQDAITALQGALSKCRGQ